MLEFVREGFRKLFPFMLWCTLIGCIISGFFWGRSEGIAILGVIAGLFIGVLLIIGVGGLISIFLNIDDNLQSIDNNLRKIANNRSSVK